ncbi:hypothetical protein NE857_21475 [Nocardiopsis exhalans]|uniref:Uncharacterized protein n=1 Tax=Nocardiopsis exhalans TaxID=163604 RepID=A0ABY5D3Q9_9ACTN|nr:hypothetical protein [Nocardiopsis exhalans]USY17888.1 hypothetical protein NE857_21475 [Nocardiopsis exhalans]
MADHTLTPAQISALGATPDQIAAIGPTLARVRAERADAGIMSAKYDALCERFAGLHYEAVFLRRRAEALEDQLRDRDTRITEVEAEIDRADLRAADLRARGKRIRELEADLARLQVLLRDAEDYLRLTHAHPAAGGGHDTLGAGFSCDGCVLTKKLKQVLTDG